MPDAIKGLGNMERDHSVHIIEFLNRGPDMSSRRKKITSRPGFWKAILVMREKIVYFKEGIKLFSDDGLHYFRDEWSDCDWTIAKWIRFNTFFGIGKM